MEYRRTRFWEFDMPTENLGEVHNADGCLCLLLGRESGLELQTYSIRCFNFGEILTLCYILKNQVTRPKQANTEIRGNSKYGSEI